VDVDVDEVDTIIELSGLLFVAGLYEPGDKMGYRD
jgi:hypothetical protein